MASQERSCAYSPTSLVACLEGFVASVVVCLREVATQALVRSADIDDCCRTRSVGDSGYCLNRASNVVWMC